MIWPIQIRQIFLSQIIHVIIINKLFFTYGLCCLKIVPHIVHVYDYTLLSDMKTPMGFTECPPILCPRSSVMLCR